MYLITCNNNMLARNSNEPMKRAYLRAALGLLYSATVFVMTVVTSRPAKTARIVYRVTVANLGVTNHDDRGGGGAPEDSKRVRRPSACRQWPTAPDVAALFGIPGTRQRPPNDGRRRGPPSGAVGFSRSPRRGFGISPATSPGGGAGFFHAPPRCRRDRRDDGESEAQTTSLARYRDPVTSDYDRIKVLLRPTRSERRLTVIENI